MGILGNVTFLLHGSKHFSKDGYARAAKSFDNAVMQRSHAGRAVMVTGATQGLGFQAAEDLARMGCTVYMVARDEGRGQAAVDKVKAATGNEHVHLKVCDVSSLQAVARLANEFAAATAPPLHVLINNAGVMIHERKLSADGLDINSATNLVGPYALTRLLVPALTRSGQDPRVVFVSSGGMYTERLDTADLNHDGIAAAAVAKGGAAYNGMLAYARDKRRQVALVERLAEELAPLGVGVYSVHPGWAATEGVKTSIPGFYSFYRDKFRDLAQGADCMSWLAVQDASKLESGGFYLDRSSQPKHLRFCGTQYTKQDVDVLMAALDGVLRKHLPQALLPSSAAATAT